MKRKVFTAFLVIVSISCSKEKSADNHLSAKTTLLTTKDWVVQKVEEREGNGVWEDVFPQFEACMKDNRFKFNSNFTVVYSEGAVACAPNTPNQVLETEAWSFNADGTVIVTGGVENKIVQLDNSKLVVVISETVAGITYETRNTYVH